MLRGNCTAKIDIKGRLKVPTPFRRYIEEKYGSQVYVTSMTGEYVRIYPLAEWEIIEQKLAQMASMEPLRRKFLDRANYFGQESEFDSQGRVLIHPLLRRSADVTGDVAVMGYLTYLEIWQVEKFESRMAADQFTVDDETALSRLGI